MTAAPVTTPTTRLPRRSTRGVILGLSAARCVALGGAVGVVIFALLGAGGGGFVVSAVIWVPLVTAAFVRARGRYLVEWLPVGAHYGARRLTGQTDYRAQVAMPRPAGTMALPGDAARLRFYNDPGTGACMVHDPRLGTLAAVVQVTHPAYLLLSPSAQHNRIRGWGNVIASMAGWGSASVLQVLESTVPDPGVGVEGWWRERGVHDASWASEQYDTLLADAREGATTHQTLVTVALNMRLARRGIAAQGRGIKGAAAVLRADMASLEHSLRAADLKVVSWLDEAHLAAVVRNAYDPAADARPDSPAMSATTAGPVAIKEEWDHLRHDSGFSTTLWVEQWPRTEQRCDFLHALIFAQGRDGEAVRKSLSLTVTPLAADRAQAQISKELTEASTDAAQKARIGQIARASDRQEEKDIEARDEALAEGHADCEYSGFITVTALTREALTSAVSVIDQAARKARCEVRIMYGAQSQAFIVGALPFARRVS
jgi:hypothetical protein